MICRCRSKSCQTADDEHDTVDVTDCVVESKESFHLWKVDKGNTIRDLFEQAIFMCCDIKNESKTFTGN